MSSIEDYIIMIIMLSQIQITNYNITITNNLLKE